MWDTEGVHGTGRQGETKTNKYHLQSRVPLSYIQTTCTYTLTHTHNLHVHHMSGGPLDQFSPTSSETSPHPSRHQTSPFNEVKRFWVEGTDNLSMVFRRRVPERHFRLYFANSTNRTTDRVSSVRPLPSIMTISKDTRNWFSDQTLDRSCRLTVRGPWEGTSRPCPSDSRGDRPGRTHLFRSNDPEFKNGVQIFRLFTYGIRKPPTPKDTSVVHIWYSHKTSRGLPYVKPCVYRSRVCRLRRTSTYNGHVSPVGCH